MRSLQAIIAPMPQHSDSADSLSDASCIRQLAEAFENCSRSRSEWTHHAHLKVGLWHLVSFPPDRALDLLRQQIRQYNETVGIINSESSGYHETITRFYVWIIAKFLRDSDKSEPIDLLAQKLIL